MIIEFPSKYDMPDIKENKKYYNSNNKKLLMVPLFKSSKGFCMYCGKSLVNDGDIVLHMEHSVDKGGNEDQEKEITFLTHCKYNFAVACPKCNDDCKKKVRKIEFGSINKLKDCSNIKCNKMCEDYVYLRNEYAKKNAIILHPQGYKVNGLRYSFGYNILKHQYEPLLNKESMDATFFVEYHINRFRLNGNRFSYSIIDTATKIVLLFNSGVKDIKKLYDVMKNDDYSNVMGCFFMSFLFDAFIDKPVTDLVEFCEMLVLLDAVD